MERKLLGKIDYAEFGLYPDIPSFYGLQLGFSLECGEVMEWSREWDRVTKEFRRKKRGRANE